MDMRLPSIQLDMSYMPSIEGGFQRNEIKCINVIYMCYFLKFPVSFIF